MAHKTNFTANSLLAGTKGHQRKNPVPKVEKYKFAVDEIKFQSPFKSVGCFPSFSTLPWTDLGTSFFQMGTAIVDLNSGVSEASCGAAACRKPAPVPASVPVSAILAHVWRHMSAAEKASVSPSP